MRIESYALLGKRVYIRCVNHLISVATGDMRIVLVRHDPQNVGLL
jgi:hypothetical protein